MRGAKQPLKTAIQTIIQTIIQNNKTTIQKRKKDRKKLLTTPTPNERA